MGSKDRSAAGPSRDTSSGSVLVLASVANVRRYRQSREHRAKQREAERGAECRICCGDGALGKLLSPCLCRGSMRYVHESCLQRWHSFTTNDATRCHVCGYQYQTRSPGSLRVFRDASNALILEVLHWGVVIVVTVAGFQLGLRVEEAVLQSAGGRPFLRDGLGRQAVWLAGRLAAACVEYFVWWIVPETLPGDLPLFGDTDLQSLLLSEVYLHVVQELQHHPVGMLLPADPRVAAEELDAAVVRVAWVHESHLRRSGSSRYARWSSVAGAVLSEAARWVVAANCQRLAQGLSRIASRIADNHSRDALVGMTRWLPLSDFAIELIAGCVSGAVSGATYWHLTRQMNNACRSAGGDDLPMIAPVGNCAEYMEERIGVAVISLMVDESRGSYWQLVAQALPQPLSVLRAELAASWGRVRNAVAASRRIVDMQD
eukprot:TRINITY_DN39694_c0_g1_i1.p1 TRINITY_DN39694_c0_g1~~TRINITY_DN39694_c0_g1_i1.p1  ORF type:complete len:431 (+),score=120.00 TRINITY_DN39694_c0_g1_i1:68-1360(+)